MLRCSVVQARCGERVVRIVSDSPITLVMTGLTLLAPVSGLCWWLVDRWTPFYRRHRPAAIVCGWLVVVASCSVGFRYIPRWYGGSGDALDWNEAIVAAVLVGFLTALLVVALGARRAHHR